MISKSAKIYVAGHKGMVGSACWEELKLSGYENLVGSESWNLDLRNKSDLRAFLEVQKPDVIIDAAARVGGILANSEMPFEFLMDNMEIQNNLIGLAHDLGVQKFIFLGSSCIYPKYANQPMKEEYLLTGPLEDSNQWYAIAKISGVKLIESLNLQYKKNFISLMPTNLYGPKDNFSLNSGHVLPALMRKFHEAKLNDHKPVELWGSGKPLREFMHVYDLARAIKFILENNLEYSLYNVGTGQELTIFDLALLIQEIVGHKGEIYFNDSKPDGTPRKLLDITRISTLGFKSQINLYDGVKMTYDWFVNNYNVLKNLDHKSKYRK